MAKLPGEVEATLKALAGLPSVVTSLQRIAEFEETLADIAKVVPSLEALAGLVPVLESLERSIASLEVTIGRVSDTLAPLQSTTARVGKVVDRLGRRGAAGQVGGDPTAQLST